VPFRKFNSLQPPDLNLEDFQSTGKKAGPTYESNPFVKYGDTPQTKQLTLYGIIHGNSKSLALINSEIVKVGDKIGSTQVVSIEKEKVILRNADGLFQISFRGTNEKM
jgi:hypothetical protein